MVGVEGFVTAVVDFWPWFRNGKWRKEIFIGLTCLGMFAIGISMTMEVIDISTIILMIVKVDWREIRRPKFLGLKGNA